MINFQKGVDKYIERRDKALANVLKSQGIPPTPENIQKAKRQGDKANFNIFPQNTGIVPPMVQTRPGAITGSSGMIAPVTPNNENESFFQKYKTPLIIGGVALVGLYFLTRK